MTEWLVWDAAAIDTQEIRGLAALRGDSLPSRPRYAVNEFASLVELAAAQAGFVAIQSDEGTASACLVAFSAPVDEAGFNPLYFAESRCTWFVPTGGLRWSVSNSATEAIASLAGAVGIETFVFAESAAWWTDSGVAHDLLDEMRLMRLAIADCTASADEQAEGLRVSFGRDLEVDHESALLQALHDGFGRESLAASPCPQLPSVEESLAYLRSPKCLKSTLWRGETPIGAALLVPVEDVPFLDAPDSAGDFFIYDVAVIPSERGWMTRHLLRPLLGFMSSNAAIWFDYTPALNPALPIGVARTFGARPAQVRHVDSLQWGRVAPR